MDSLNFSTPKYEDGLRPRRNLHIDDAPTAILAVQADDLEQAYRIRYAAYHSSGNLSSQKEPIFRDKYDCEPNFRTALVFKNDVPAATVRIGDYRTSTPSRTECRLPVMEIFGSEIEAILLSVRTDGIIPTAVEIGRLARSPAFDDDSRLVFALFRVAGYFILHLDADVVFNAVRVHHIPVYRRFGFQQLGEPRLYPGLTLIDPLILNSQLSVKANREGRFGFSEGIGIG